MNSKRSYNLYAAITPSLEPLLKKELLNLLLKKNNIINSTSINTNTDLKDNKNNNNNNNKNSKNNNNSNNNNNVELNIDIKLDKGGVECSGLSPEQLWTIAHHSRLSESLRVRLGQPFRSVNFNMLKSSLKDLPWGNFYRVTEHTLPECSVSCSHSALYHSNAVKDRILDHFQKNVIFTKKPILVNNNGDNSNNNNNNNISSSSNHSKIYVRLIDDMMQVSVDVGDSMHKRTPNKHVTDAPIRETLAAALLMSAGLLPQSDVNIWDPFMGSGTILQEALAMAIGGRATPPERYFSFQSWPLHRDDKYNNFIARINQEQLQLQKTFQQTISTHTSNFRLYGSDIDQRAIDATKHNIYNQFKFLENINDSNNNNNFIQLLHGDFKVIETKIKEQLQQDKQQQQHQHQQKLTIITNLPYGERIMTSNKNISDGLKSTFISFGKMIRESNIIKDVYVLNGHPKFIELSGVQWLSILKFTNGGLPVEFLKMKR
ncbi:putative RNA methylase domain-containing protein [Heterostelium album PN500]|uniref:Putative RNA methylase domain-containing protein n=1 Tax=Heterostelium pallidum (strain ATCC 26659 / Pp 5 / PN500) TaxID=670386 RepID=D3B2D9_HETP5|nr:putative RNA methylase domain-containing protein [Heterostelium album PN500]EFA84514.1 putative RNA methylase domain-containing protein [Heterostelium album PN500]|eukprot:XP_020436627.1 putative RNA methylase domain-containing protein [Heterostelium album PN500]